MRTIKFRGKERSSGLWVYGHYSIGGFIHSNGTETERHLIHGEVLYDVNPYTVGQFTGLVDNNGKEIYEGDIMNNPTSKNIGVVKWNSVLCQFQLSWQNMPTAADIFFMAECDSFVIGNIHDNPELLKGGNNE